jgi:hypothetical protein
MYASTEGGMTGYIGPKCERKESMFSNESLADLLEDLLRRQRLEPLTPSKEYHGKSLWV